MHLHTKLTKLVAVGTALWMTSTLACQMPVYPADVAMRSISTMELVRDMGQGINLGNTFEACGDWIAQSTDGSVQAYETAWGSPVVTQQMIAGYAEAGFGVLRIPVAWSNRMGSDGTIDKAYLRRVQQVVDWTLDTGMYVILNLHWDGGWLENYPTDKTGCMNRYRNIWTQVRDAFAAYDDHLMFESQNEELGWMSVWNQYSGSTNGKAESYGMVTEINQAFVDLIRSGTGNNPQRHLLISGYVTDVQLTCDAMFQMPNDPMHRCAVSMHYYIPSTFAILEEDASWGKNQSTWGSESDLRTLETNMKLMETTFVEKGIPVIIGEYGCPKKNKDANSVRTYLSSVAKSAYAHNLCPVLWDIPGGGGYCQYDRTSCQFTDQTLLANLQAIYNYKTAHSGQQSSSTPTTIGSGALIQDLCVNDTENAADWSIAEGFQTGVQLYGDRDLTAASAPSSLTGAEYIRTACDSKLYPDTLASFTASEEIVAYVAVDTRVNGQLDWLQAWTKTGDSIRTSNDVELELFRMVVQAGETVTLGTNGGQGDSANYLVLAQLLRDAARMRGDVDGNGVITAIDLSFAKRGVLTSTYADEKAKDAADVDQSGTVDATDMQLLDAYLLGMIGEFPVVIPPEPEKRDTKVANPVIWADVPDMDYIRVNDTYYMVSTTMFFNPGAPIMKSKDLVSWEICNYVYDTLENNDTTNLLNGKSCYGNGQWAASIRYRNGTYIVFFASNDQGKSYIFQTNDIEHGTWQKYTLNGVYHDASLFLDDDGKNYLIYGSGTISIKQLNSTVTGFEPNGVSQVLMKGQWEGLCEGSHFYKIGGYYYNFVIGKWPRSEMVFRSSTLLGTYDYQTVMSSGVGGYSAGCAQGGLIDTADGQWYSIMFQDHGAVGRIPCLIPVTWQNHWPVFGVDGKVPTTLTIHTNYTGTNLASSDEFTGTELPLEWQWNHNPDNTKWSMTERSGWLRLKTGAIASDLLTARNSLTQRTEGPACSGNVKMDVSKMKAGDYAGLAAFQEVYGQVGVRVDDSGNKKVFMAINGDGNQNGIGCKGGVTKIVEEVALQSDIVYFKIDYQFATFDNVTMSSSADIDKAYFYYSYDGSNWTRIGDVLSMKYKLTLFTGYRNAIFNYATKSSGGYVDVDYFHYEKTAYQPALQ